MKKLLTISLALAMLLMAAGCGSTNNGETSGSANSGYEDVTAPGSTPSSSEEVPPSAEETDSTDNSGDTANEDTKCPSGETGDSSAVKPDAKPAQKPASNTSKPTGKTDNKTNSKPSGKTDSKSDTKPEQSSTAKNYSGTLPQLIKSIYAASPVDLDLNDPVAVDLTDSYQVQFYLGLSDASGVQEAYVSEPMMSSQPYSLVVLRMKDGADASAVAKSMYEGINQAKWICVSAGSLAVGSYGDTAMLAMIGTDFGEDIPVSLRSAYAGAVGGKLSVSLDRVDADL